MHKKINIFISVLLLTQLLVAKEPTMALLINIESNDLQEFKVGNYSFQCKPYGVLGLDELYKESSFNSICKESIKKFYKKRKDLQYYTMSKLHVMQMYSIEFRGDRCIINAVGGKSLSELLLQEGLAVRQPFVKDEEYEYYFDKYQNEAKLAKKGVWKENITRECVANIYKR